jgi:excisionase family DNA binding protein
MEIEKLLLSITEVSQLLNISRATFFSLRSCGRIPLKAIKLGGKVLYPKTEVMQWVSAGCPAKL